MESINWINIKDNIPEITPIGTSSGISGKVLVWLDTDKTFVTASLVVDFEEQEFKWITGYNGIDVTVDVTYWAYIKGPHDN
jgi:hypothetical protein